MNELNVASWKKAFYARKRVHVVFVLLLITAYACYAVGLVFEAGVVFGAGWVLELVSWLVLGIGTSRDDPNGPRGGLR